MPLSIGGFRRNSRRLHFAKAISFKFNGVSLTFWPKMFALPSLRFSGNPGSVVVSFDQMTLVANYPR